MSKHITIVVLGDLGRSPRMQYHAVSMAKAGFTVSLVGSVGEPCIADVINSPAIVEHRLLPWRCSAGSVLIYGPFKILYQVFQLFFLLFSLPYSTAILVQNPPSIPTLLVVWIVCRLRGSRFIIDWHNFGYTILEMSLPPNNMGSCVCKIANSYEKWMGRRADASLCVTIAMQKWLFDEWGINATVLHDRPPSFFCKTPLDIKHNLFHRLRADFTDCYHNQEMTHTLITKKIKSVISLRNERPAIVLSSTSWTLDEDFGILFDAIELLRQRVLSIRKEGGTFPCMVFIITGKGPQREMYENRMRTMKLAQDGFHFVTMWLKSDDYPLLLGSVDMGVCLHTSSSGLDLPMKIVDMFGCQLPVCAYNFNCLNELVVDGQNGMIFNNSSELAIQLYNVFNTFPKKTSLLQKLKAGFDIGWHDNWRTSALPVFEDYKNK